MANLNAVILQHIIKYLNVDEIYRLLLLNKDLVNFFQQKNVIEYILRIYYPEEIFQKIQSQHLFQCLKSLKQMNKQELPFWGIETNAGLYQNSLRFWIGKSFMKTRGPQVALRKSENSFISGTLALDQVQFKRELVNYNREFEAIFGKNTMMNFINDSDDEGDQIDNFDYVINAENIRILDTFISLQHFFHYVDNAEEFDSVKYLQNYVQTKSQAIHQMVNLDLYHLFDHSHQAYTTIVSFVEQIEIDRETEFNQIVQTLFIFTSQFQYIPNNKIENCQTPQQLVQFIKLNKEQFYPTYSNIKLLQDEFNLPQDFKHIHNFLYCEFKPVGDCQPLLWIQIINPLTMRPQIEFNCLTKRLAKSISVQILNTQFKEDYEYNGVSFSYISLKGLVFNEATWALINQL